LASEENEVAHSIGLLNANRSGFETTAGRTLKRKYVVVRFLIWFDPDQAKRCLAPWALLLAFNCPSPILAFGRHVVSPPVT